MKRQGEMDRRELLAVLAGAGASASGMLAASAGIALAAPVLLQAVPGTPSAPAFALPDLDGKTRTLDEFSGRIMVVNFWATWCPPCRAEIPSMQRSLAKLDEAGAVMLAIHVGGDADEVWSFLTPLGVTFPVLIDASGSVSRAWQTVGLPTTHVVDPAGRKSLRAIGERTWDAPEIIAQIVALKQPAR